MKKKQEFLSHISSNKQEYTWASIALLFWVMASLHATTLGALFITASSMLPMLILQQLLRRLLIPRFLHRASLLYYLHSFFAIIVLTAIAVFLDKNIYKYLLNKDWMEVSENMQVAMENGILDIGYAYLNTKHIVLLTVTLAVVTVSHLLDERNRIEQEAIEQQMQLELKYLRAQINPHFLFNALNCIYSLTLTGDDTAPDSVLKLSEMLRYVIDDCCAETVPIAKEVAYINNFIDFQKIRMEHKPNITFDCRIEDETFSIPPMIFQPMVENCFKHSRIVDDANAYIRISLIQKAGHVMCVTDNSKPTSKYAHKDEERTGIGMQNVRQRLELLFGSDYEFEVTENESTFKTKLKF